MNTNPIPQHGDGENHPDVVALRHALADIPAAHLAEAGDYAAAAERLGGDWTAERLKAAHAYIRSRDSSPRPRP